MVLKALYAHPRAGIIKMLLIMKLTAVFLLVTCLAASARGYSQKITLNEKEASLDKVFTKIKNQTGYSFLYLEDVLQQARPVTVELKNADLSEALKKCFAGQPLVYEIIEKTVVIKVKHNISAPVISAPPLIVTRGRVVDAEGRPVAGASVQVKGTSIKGTATSAEGYFELKELDEDAVLVISGVNIETLEVKVNGKVELGELVVKLKVSEGEGLVIMSTGYQTLPKERATGSFSTINNSQLNQRITSSIIGRLEGMATGLLFSPLPAPGLTVRGINSLSSGIMEPLIVVDNFPYQGNIENINPNDIENITILKDAAAASIWGARAGNGVIVITTKKGRLNQPVQVSLTMNQAYVAKPDVYKINNMTSRDFIDVEKMLFNGGYYQPLENDLLRQPLSPVVELLIRQRDGLIDQAEVDRQLGQFARQNILDDFNKYWYSSGLNQQYNLSVQGGGAQSAWLFSLGYDNNQSTLQDRNERVTMRINNQYLPFAKVRLTTELAATQNTFNMGRQPYNSATLINNSQKSLYPYAKLVDENGRALPVVNQFRSAYTDTAGNGQLLDWNYYPYSEKENNIRQTKTTDVVANIALRYSVSKSVHLEARYQYERQQISAGINQTTSSYFTTNMINSYAQRGADGNITFPVPIGGILDQTEETLDANSFRIQSDFSHAWGKSNIVGVAGFESGMVKVRSNSYRTFGYKTENQNFSETDNTTLFPQYYFPAVMLPIFSGRNINGTNHGRVSYFFNTAYSYDKRYTVSFSARTDQSNLFGSRTNERSVPLWSSGMSWNLLEEKFIKIPFLSQLKFRFTYGFNGNMNANTSAITIISHYPGTIQLPPYAAVALFPNPDLKWEKVRNINLGLDISTHKDKFTARIEYFNKRITNLLSGVPIDYTAGFTTIPKNAATMYGRGIELDLSGRIGNNKFLYMPTLLLSFVSNKIAEDYLATSLRASAYIAGGGLTRIPGKSPYSLISYPWAGLNGENGNPVGRLDGQDTENYSAIISQTNVEDAIYHGSSIPTVFGTFRNSFSWKSFSLTVQLLYKGGYYFRRSSIRYGLLYDNWIGHGDFALRWQKPGDENVTSVPSLQYPLGTAQRDNFYVNSAATVERGDHIRLQDINLSYNLSRSLFGKFTSFQVYAIANNLGIIWKANKKGLDPNSPDQIPQPYNITFGIKATF